MQLSVRERQKLDRKTRIFEAALALYRKRGFEEATVLDIAKAAQVSRGTVFNYYPYKEAILIEDLAQQLESMEARVKKRANSPTDALYCVFEELADYFEKNRDLVLPLCYELLNPDPERSKYAFTSLPLARICKEYLAQARAADQVGTKFSTDRLARTVANTFFITALQWAAYRQERSIHDELKKALELTLEGIIV